MAYSERYIKFCDQHCPGVSLDNIWVLYRALYEVYKLEEKLKEKGLSEGGDAYIHEFFSTALEKK